MLTLSGPVELLFMISEFNSEIEGSLAFCALGVLHGE